MRDRTLAVIITIVAVVLIGFPGLAFLCLGVIDFIVYYGFNVPFLGNTPVWVNVLGSIGVCLGLFLLAITIIASYFLLRRPSETLPSIPSAPAPPAEPDQPASPSNPEDPLPPSY
jgi:hypothetical protein